MALPDFTGQNIQDTYKRVLQVDENGIVYDGTGSLAPVLQVTSSFSISASHEITLEVSSSHAQTADKVGSFTAAAVGQCYDTIANNGQGQIIFTELDNGTDNLSLTNLTTQGNPTFGTLEFSTSPQNIADDFGLRSTIFFPEGASGDNGVHLKVKTDTISPGVFLGGRNEDIISFLDQENNLVATINQSGVFSGTATKATTFDPSSDQTLNNDKDILGKKTDGTARHLISMSPQNIVRVGATAEPLSIRSSGNIHVTGSIISANDISLTHITASGNISSSGTVTANSLVGTLSTAAQTNITSVGALTGGSIGSGFGSINVGGNSITTTGTVTTGPLVATNNISLTTANGHITASGNISSSGDIIANRFFADGAQAKGHISVDSTDTHLGTNLGWTVGTNITASGDISSSGIITANNAHVDSLNHKDGTDTQIAFSTNQVRINVGSIVKANFYTSSIEFVNGHITASGDISASGLISAANFHVPGQGRISFDNTDTDDQFIKGLDNSIVIDGDDTIRLKADNYVEFADDSNNAQVSIDGNNGHITASGNISSSGNLIVSESLEFGGSNATISANGELLIRGQSPTTLDRIRIAQDNIDLMINGLEYISVEDNQILLNAGNQDCDVKITYDDGTNAFHSDAANNRVKLRNHVTIGDNSAPNADGSTSPFTTSTALLVSGSQANIGHLSVGVGGITGHITASGNISSSGDIIGTINGGSF